MHAQIYVCVWGGDGADHILSTWYIYVQDCWVWTTVQAGLPHHQSERSDKDAQWWWHRVYYSGALGTRNQIFWGTDLG